MSTLPVSPGHEREAGDLPATSAEVPADLRASLALAVVEAEALRPTVKRLAALCEEAVSLAVARFPGGDPALDAPFDRFLIDSGAEALSKVLYDLALLADPA
jgi:hypothetical protein